MKEPKYIEKEEETRTCPYCDQEIPHTREAIDHLLKCETETSYIYEITN